MTLTTSSRIATFAMAAFVVVSLWTPTLTVPTDGQLVASAPVASQQA